MFNPLKGMTEEELIMRGLEIRRELSDEDAAFVAQIMLDRGFLLGRVKLIAEALEEGSNPTSEVAGWSRQAFDEVKTWEVH